MKMSKVPLRCFCHSRVCGIFVLLILLLFGSNLGKQSKQQSHSSQQHSKPCSPLPRQTVGSPGISSMPVISITLLEISLLIHSHYQHIKSAPQKERTEKMLPPQLLSHELLPNNGMRKERKHFLPKYFPVLGIKIFNSCDEYILPHFCRFVNKA